MRKNEARDRLEALAARMYEQFPDESAENTVVPKGVWLPLDDAVWLQQGISKALQPKGSLDRALGLTGSVGAPKGPASMLIAEVFAEMSTEPTQETIADRVQEKYPETFPNGVDVRVVRRALFKPGGELTREAVNAISEVIKNRLEKRQGQN